MGATESKKRKQQKRKFIAVDVWRTHFGATSVSAIFDIYSQKFRVETSTMRKNQHIYTFQKCVDSLRKLENPNYEPPQDTTIY